MFDPLDRDVISVLSCNFATLLKAQLGAAPRDIVVIDEAHKLRNAHRKSPVGWSGNSNSCVQPGRLEWQLQQLCAGV